MSSLIKKTVRGAAWTIGSSMSARLIGVVGTLILTHYLAPEVVGEVAIAHLLIHTSRRLSTVGFGQYIVATKDLKSQDIGQITALNLIFGIVGFVLVWIFAKPLSPWLKAPGMYLYVPGLLLSAFIDRLAFVPERVLVRSMSFKAISLTRALTEISFTLVAVAGAALFDWSGQALVAGNIVRSALTALVFITLVKFKDWAPSFRFDKERLKDVFQFGIPLWISTNAHFFSRTWDTAIFSKFFGAAMAGQYNLAYNLASIPSAQIGEHIGDVLLPSFSRVDDAGKERALVRATGLMSLLVFPLAVGLGAISETLISTLLSQEWQRVAPYLTILAVLSVVRPISWNINSYLQSRRRTRTLMVLGLQKVILLFPCIAGLAVVGGDYWACVGVGLVFAFHTLASIWVIRQKDNISGWKMSKGMLGPLVACIPMVAVILAIRQIHIEPMGLGLAAEVILGGAAYAASALVIAKKESRDFISLLKKSFGRGSNPEV